jgi:predicted O-linked N-acetylglucosamine transferase (SPINDLY family)
MELTPADNREALRRQFAHHGIDRARLLILPGTTRQGVLETYADVDISLDTFPYCGGNTIAESLWQGVPVVTLQGDRCSSAYGAAVLTSSGLADLIAHTPEEYVRLAAGLAGDQARLLFYRANLRRMVMEHGFSDADRYTAGLDAAYLAMLAERGAGIPLSGPHEHAPEYVQE